MHILLTGATGYIGQRLLPLLVEAGHHVICLVRDARRFEFPERLRAGITVAEADLLKPESLAGLPLDIDVAYYLVHSMSGHDTDFFRLEQASARNFVGYLNGTRLPAGHLPLRHRQRPGPERASSLPQIGGKGAGQGPDGPANGAAGQYHHRVGVGLVRDYPRPGREAARDDNAPLA